MLLNKPERSSDCNGVTMKGNDRIGETHVTEEDYKKLCEELLNSLSASWIHSWQIGLTKVLLLLLLFCCYC